MRRVSIYALMGLVLFCNTAYPDNYDFRGVRWGMSKAEVLKSESNQPVVNKKNMVAYKTRMLERSVILVYFFTNDILFRARYFLKGAHTNYNFYIDDYEAFKTALTKKYGQPLFDKYNWGNDLYKTESQSWGMAVAMGHLGCFSGWETDTTDINCVLTGDNMEVSCILNYDSKKYLPMYEEKKQQATEDGL